VLAFVVAPSTGLAHWDNVGRQAGDDRGLTHLQINGHPAVATQFRDPSVPFTSVSMMVDPGHEATLTGINLTVDELRRAAETIG